MHSLNPSLSACPAVLTVELSLDASASGQRPPPPLDPIAAEKLGWALAEDLKRILGPVDQYGLALIGGLYDLTEILRPGLPLVETLMELYRGSLQGGPFVPQLMALGAPGGHFPISDLAPARQPGAGPMLVIPFLLLGDSQAMDAMERKLEAELLEKGRAGFATEQVIREQFGLQPENLAYATFNDLCALLKLQLEHAGFGGLWTLLEGALFRPQGQERVELETGNLFLRDGGHILSVYYTPAQWLAQAGGTLEGYKRWLQRQRQFLAGLQAHGLSVELIKPDPALSEQCADSALGRAQTLASPADDSYFSERLHIDAAQLPQAAFLTLTEHSLGALGPVAHTVYAQSADGEVLYLGHEYPLSPAGVEAVRRHWEQKASELGLNFHLLQPGRMVMDEDKHRLMPLLED
ncbi:hypothetical protein [Alkalilimnicola sp. S0819]|uniref:hypothetical protein n=1 Tax=Alkalilimnicola sp. S0819 TaxID=2613922 RepID=UPI001261AE0A|nr:hypothetical protein [Alkalilimnicola sp. S0819]KAB7628410.1 hypothetical protein F3N43_01555 [Alkalilimnicola sp. S0819]MPQ15313.1 hypothetical protein [Alkalilimnicola sp. S0819]